MLDYLWGYLKTKPFANLPYPDVPRLAAARR
jgi:hypothetical protein